MPDDLLTLDEVADLIGVAPRSIRVYHQRASNRRRAGKATDTDMPAPESQFGRTPVWSRAAITAWDAAREKRPEQRKAAEERTPVRPRARA
jgi:hypothetical protein